MSAIIDGETIQSRRQRLSGIPRACEACRVRKVRCDRTTPCSNCAASGIVCQGSNPTTDIRPKSDRVSQLEERIEDLEGRLRAVEKQHTNQNILAELTTVEHERASSLPSDATNLYEGDPSFANQLVQASEVIQRMTPGAPGLDASFGDLRALLQSSNKLEDHRFPRNQELQAVSSMAPLPFPLVAAVLRRIKERTPIFCYGYFLTDVSMIERLFQDAYSFTKPVTPSHITSVFGILYFILKEFIATSDQLCQEHDLNAHLTICEQNFTAGIETYEILAIPSFESILALAFGASKAQEDAKPFLFCTLISAAANHSRTLGYHRQKTHLDGHNGNAENARRLFWSIYISDKTLSMLLGRASILQDLDIDTPCPAVSTNPVRRPWDQNFVMAIRMARVQGQVYDRLYSPAALKAPAEQRAQTINELTDIMTSWRDQQTKIDASRAAYSQIWFTSRHHWDVIYYSTLTTLLRAPITNGSEITSHCFHSARLSLQSHMSCFSAWEKCGVLSGKDYANWVLHYSSFTCFVVIFLHAISAVNTADVQLLDDVVETLNNVREASKHSEKLYKICAILARLARELVSSQNSHFGTYNSQVDTLQFLEHSTQSPTFQPQAVQDSLAVGMTDYLEDWEAYNMGAVLANWANGECTTLDMYMDI